MTAVLAKDAIVVRNRIDWVAAIPDEYGWSVVDNLADTVRFDGNGDCVRALRPAIEHCSALIDDPTYTDTWRDLYREMRTQLRRKWDEAFPYRPGRP